MKGHAGTDRTQRWLNRYWHPCRCGSTFPWHWHYGRCGGLGGLSVITDPRCCCEVLYGCDTLPLQTLRSRKAGNPPVLGADRDANVVPLRDAG